MGNDLLSELTRSFFAMLLIYKILVNRLMANSISIRNFLGKPSTGSRQYLASIICFLLALLLIFVKKGD